MKQTASTQFKEADFMHETWLQTALKALETANLTADQRMQLEVDIAYQVSYEDGLLSKGRKEGRKEGIAEGEAKGSEKGVVAMLKSGKLTTGEVASLMQMPIAQVEAVKAKYGL